MSVVVPATMNVTYAEFRWWARWLDTFTASDLADAMGVDLSMGERGIAALLWHGICDETGEHLDGPDGPEPIIYYKPLPPGPSDHETGVPPEVIAVMETGGFLLYDPRGMPVRLVDNTDRRNAMQGTGGARVRMKLRDARFDAMQQAKMDRAEKQRKKDKQRAAQNGKKRAKASVPVNPNRRHDRDPYPDSQHRGRKTTRRSK